MNQELFDGRKRVEHGYALYTSNCITPESEGRGSGGLDRTGQRMWSNARPSTQY